MYNSLKQRHLQQPRLAVLDSTDKYRSPKFRFSNRQLLLYVKTNILYALTAIISRIYLITSIYSFN